MKIAIDTNRYTDLARGEPDCVRIVATADDVIVPFVVMAELLAGFAFGSRETQNIEVLERFLAKPGVRVAWPTTETVRTYATLYAALRRQGTQIPEHDIWIGAIAIGAGASVFTRDKHFSYMKSVSLL